MSAPSIILLPSTQGQYNVVGTPLTGGGIDRTVSPLYSIMLFTAKLTGRVYIEGSLKLIPGDSDWFAIPQPGNTNPYVEFPIKTSTEMAQIIGWSFRGNIASIRARLNRDYLGYVDPSPEQISMLGSVDKILINFGGLR